MQCSFQFTRVVGTLFALPSQDCRLCGSLSCLLSVSSDSCRAGDSKRLQFVFSNKCECLRVPLISAYELMAWSKSERPGA